MDAPELIISIQQEIHQLQEKFNLLLKVIDASSGKTLLTRQEAAQLLGKTIRQLDRDCKRFGIPKVYANGGVRIRKADILMHLGEVPDYVGDKTSELDRIINKHL